MAGLPTELRAALTHAAILHCLGSQTALALLPYDVRF